MNGSIDLSLHGWRGIGPDIEPDLFVWNYRLGFATLSISRVPVVRAYQDVKRSAERLRAAIREALPGEGR